MSSKSKNFYNGVWRRFAGFIYHKWYYERDKVWQGTRFLGITTMKSVSDMWNYQEIITDIKPAVIVEFGSFAGGSAIFFNMIGRAVNPDLRVLSVDIDHGLLDPRVKDYPEIEFLESSSTADGVIGRIAEMRAAHPGPAFFILDSDHSKAHVLNEMLGIRDVLQADDYVVVEDANVNGHPVAKNWGPGPFEAMEEYFRRYPHDYLRDSEREHKFAFSLATSRFLIFRGGNRKTTDLHEST
jgi:cephalosporin hydroxylase